MRKTTDAVKIINNLIGNDLQMQQMVAESALNAEIGQLIYNARTQTRLTQQQLAQLIRVDESIIIDLEEGDYEGNSFTMLQKIATALKQKVKLELVSI